MNNELDKNWDVQETEEAEEQEQDDISYEINYYPADITLKGYLAGISHIKRLATPLSLISIRISNLFRKVKIFDFISRIFQPQ